MRLPLILCLSVVLCPSLVGQSADPRAEVENVLQRLKFTAPEIAALHSGSVIAKADTVGGGEMVAHAAVKIGVPHAQVVSYYGQMIAYVDGTVTLGFGEFRTPATPADVAKLAFDRDEIDALKKCRPGNCDIRLGGAGLTALQSTIDWNAADYPERVNAFARKAAVDYVTAYRARGDDALVTYNDRDKPTSLKGEWSGIMANAAAFHAFRPELARYLTAYPKEALPGARDHIYWIKEVYGLKPTISIVHGVVYTPAGQTDRTIVAQKYLYASHFYDASLALASIASGTENGAPVSYIVYANRSRGEMLRGGLGLKREVARSQARKAAEDTLGTIKTVLERAAAGR